MGQDASLLLMPPICRQARMLMCLLDVGADEQNFTSKGDDSTVPACAQPVRKNLGLSYSGGPFLQKKSDNPYKLGSIAESVSGATSGLPGVFCRSRALV